MSYAGIDERLIHGRIGRAMGGVRGGERTVLVANDEVAEDRFSRT
ncbi:PTS sugar transporter subunit IIB [Enterobacter cloacae subsp. cloacae]|nr:PTS sugar transporter subunit IIB [Enterobacter cloacae subsp. cloacae]